MAGLLGIIGTFLGTTTTGATLTTLGTLAGAGTAIGSTIAGDVSKPSSTAAPTALPTLPTGPTPQMMQQVMGQVSSGGANAQAATGQGLSPGATAALTDQLYGTPG
jgi:hypothetical protein